VTNAAKVRVTGNKSRQKRYYRHSGYPGGLKSITLEEMMQKNPERAVEQSVRGMLPHTRLGNVMRKRLKVYAGENHPHQAQVKQATEKETR
jgi:large subunit ribosomal protein L13